MEKCKRCIGKKLKCLPHISQQGRRTYLIKEIKDESLLSQRIHCLSHSRYHESPAGSDVDSIDVETVTSRVALKKALTAWPIPALLGLQAKSSPRQRAMEMRLLLRHATWIGATSTRTPCSISTAIADQRSTSASLDSAEPSSPTRVFYIL